MREAAMIATLVLALLAIGATWFRPETEAGTV
jgi:hypothetical protein